VRNNIADSLSQYSKHSDELMAGGSEILANNSTTGEKEQHKSNKIQAI
jgi:hypothetical protein